MKGANRYEPVRSDRRVLLEINNSVLGKVFLDTVGSLTEIMSKTISVAKVTFS
jgi:hypothetical protein